ncbi:MAG: hypothetical protein E6J91_24970 [Deltaproteobacteria bacterium]|nr:MAG: hypothetical protein E6J91_24970 [Deltaproteobacteria bacterium]
MVITRDARGASRRGPRESHGAHLVAGRCAGARWPRREPAQARRAIRRCGRGDPARGPRTRPAHAVRGHALRRARRLGMQLREPRARVLARRRRCARRRRRRPRRRRGARRGRARPGRDPVPPDPRAGRRDHRSRARAEGSHRAARRLPAVARRDRQGGRDCHHRDRPHRRPADHRAGRGDRRRSPPAAARGARRRARRALERRADHHQPRAGRAARRGRRCAGRRRAPHRARPDRARRRRRRRRAHHRRRAAADRRRGPQRIAARPAAPRAVRAAVGVRHPARRDPARARAARPHRCPRHPAAQARRPRAAAHRLRCPARRRSAARAADPALRRPAARPRRRQHARPPRRRAADPRPRRGAQAHPPAARRAQPRPRPARRAHRQGRQRHAGQARRLAGRRLARRQPRQGRAPRAPRRHRRRADRRRAVRRWQAGAELVPLTGGGWGRLPKSWLDQHGQRLADLLATAGDERRVPIYALPDLGKLCAELDQPPPPELERLRPLLDEFTGIPAVHPEGQFTGELRPYQQHGLDWLAFCRDAGLGCVLADDMGLGKTIQALAVIRGRTLVVSPTSVLFNWLAETRRFRPDLRVATYRGARRSLETDADVVLTSYPLLRNDSDVLAGVTWDTVVLDESQTIKNPDSQVARAAYRLRAAWKLTLSGTPVENRLDELWSQIHFTRRPCRRRPPARAHPPLRAAPDEVRGRPRPAAAHRRAHVRRARRPRARHLRLDPRRHPERDRRAAPGRRRRHGRARGLAPPPPGRVPHRAPAHRRARRRRGPAVIQDRAPARGPRGRRRRRPPRPRVLAVDQPPRSDRAPPHRRRHPVQPARRQHRRSRRCRRRLPGRRRPARHAALAQGRRHRPQPHHGQPRRALRPLVEPGRRRPSARSRLAPRADAHGRLAPSDLSGDDRRARRCSRDARSPASVATPRIRCLSTAGDAGAASRDRVASGWG